MSGAMRHKRTFGLRQAANPAQPPYLALYRPTKTTFLPGQRVKWRTDGDDKATVLSVSERGDVTADWDTSVIPEEWPAECFLHLPHQRGQQ